MAEPRSRQLLLAKVEATYGTDPIPVEANDAFLAVNPVITPQAEQLERRPAAASFGLLPAAVGARFVEITFSVELRGSGTNDVPPRGLAALLKACGFKETITALSDVTYDPRSSGLESCTIYHWVGDRRHIITGCIGNVELVAGAGQHAMLNFTMRGVYVEPTTVTQPASPVFDATLPPVVLSAGFTIGGIATLVAQQLQVNMQNEIAQRDDVNAASAIKGFALVDRSVIGSFNPEQEALATHNPFADWAAGTTRALSMVVGSAAGNKCTITAPKVTYRTIATGDRNGILTYDHEIQLGKDTGDDEIKLKFE